jgi:hypothetical protein
VVGVLGTPAAIVIGQLQHREAFETLFPTAARLD